MPISKEIQIKRIRSQLKRRHASLLKDVDTAKKLMVTTESDALSYTELIDQLEEHIVIISDSLKNYDSYVVELSENADEDDDTQSFSDELDQMSDFSIEVGRWISRMTAYSKRLRGRFQVSGGANPSPNIHDISGGANASFVANSDESQNSNLTLAGIEQQINRLVEHTTGGGGSINSPQSNLSTKLPKLEMRKFNGNLLTFQEFWESFEAAVDQNTKLQPIEKMNYLLCQLEGEAKAVISGLPLSSDSYSVAIDLIKERFGNPQTLVASLYSRLSNLATVPNITSKLRGLYDELECISRSLVALNQSVDNQQFISTILSKLPHEVVLILERSKGLGVEWSTDLIRRVLHSELSAREAADRSRGNLSAGAPGSTSSAGTTSRSQIRPQKSTAEALYAGDKIPTNSSKPKISKRCIYCENESHWSDECRKFPTSNSRRDKIKGRCYNCLSNSHTKKNCTIQKACPYCTKIGHHRSLCNIKFGAGKKENAHIATESECTSGNETFDPKEKEETLLSIGDQVLLQTVTTGVRKVGVSTNYIDNRLLLDPGCHRSYITEALARKLNLQLQEGEIISVNTFGSIRHKDVATKTATIELRTKDGKFLQISVNVVPHITGDVQRSPVQFGSVEKTWEHLQLADHLPTQKEISTIHILIGSDFYLDIITGEKIKVKDGLYLLGSTFGWILSGRIDNQVQKQHNDLSMWIHICPSKLILRIIGTLKVLGITDPPDVIDDDRAIQTFENTIQFEKGRYQVCFPWKDEVPELATNFNLSLYRLKLVVEKRLSENPMLLTKYNDIIQDQLNKGVIEKIDEDVRDGPRIHYLPHHPVITEQKATTKVRIVYDASAKSKKGSQSLNECLLRGPIILSDLCGLLIRFRQEPIAMISDIEKAFLQVGLQKHDSEVTRFFWLRDPTIAKVEENIQIYRFCRVPFGAISSPFLLAATCVHHLKKDDNVITGIDSVEKAKDFYMEAKRIFNSATMNLREWATNSQELSNFIPEIDRAKIDNLKVLGVVWKPLTDTIAIAPFGSIDVNTKRDVLKAIASIFDPLGYFAPVTIKGKMFLQELWSQKLDWDDPIPEDKKQEWTTIAKELEKILSILFPRFLMINKEEEFRLICFCDASKRCYATTVYLISLKEGIPTSSHFVFAKARLAPKKNISLPRLELLAVVIGTRSLRFVQEQSRLHISQLIIFTDSQCVLHWICSTKNLERFVANRLKEIKACPNVSFRYVNTNDNPADLPTRGRTVEDMGTFWFQGPSWLLRDDTQWPKYDVPIITQETLQTITDTEKQNCSVLFETGLSAREDPADLHSPFNLDLNRYPTIIKVLRITAWCLRFVKPRQVPFSSNLTANEIYKARIMWDKYVQSRGFPSLATDLTKGTNSLIINQLSLFLDVDGIIRCSGRLKNSQLKSDAIYPKLLPKKHRFTELNILECHSRMAHSGAAQTLAELRNEYWITPGRTVVKGILKSCQICRKWEGGSYKRPIMPDVPKERVVKADPFSHVGVDYFGPLYIKENTAIKKCWICLYTCMVTRAVHLELMRDMTTEQFMMGFRRFTARRGKPNQIISDNARQFQLSNGVIADVWRSVINDPIVQDFSANKHITWKFIVQLAPWMGGFYECLVGIVKRALKKALGPLCLNYDQLNTLLTEIEWIVNSRPLSYIGDDLNTNGVLTPARLLYVGTCPSIPAVDISDTEDDATYIPNPNLKYSVVQSWKKGLRHLDIFWKVWKNEYLLSLRERKSMHQSSPGSVELCPKVGQVVLLKENMIPRGRWRLARIVCLNKGVDDLFRSATVVVSSGSQFSRPINHLFPVETETQSYNFLTPQTSFVKKQDIPMEKRSQRSAAKKAQQRITNILQKEGDLEDDE